jgi:type IV pilus assembly protein PilP
MMSSIAWCKRCALWFFSGMTLLLLGCSAHDEEVTEWITEQQKLARPRVEKIPEPRKFIPQPYEGASAVEPFSSKKLVAGTSLPSEKSNALLMAERQRRKEPLEAFPLDSIAMVGSVRRGDGPYALLRVDNMLHYVTLGNYVGQNFGKITAISETDLTLREIVQDASGEWVERSMTLQLQETAQ